MNDLKNTISNIVAIVLVALGAVQTYLQGVNEINWLQLALLVGGAIISYLTGKGSDGKKIN